MVPEKSFGLVCFEFSPKTHKFWSFTSQIILNHNSTNIHNLHLYGLCYDPMISLENEGKLFFPPSYTGVA